MLLESVQQILWWLSAEGTTIYLPQGTEHDEASYRYMTKRSEPFLKTLPIRCWT